MQHRILLLLTVVAMLLVMLAMALATAAFAQSDQGEQQRQVACDKSRTTPAFDNVPFCEVTI
jgi:flagellar basal body-associated protein FliL